MRFGRGIFDEHGCFEISDFQKGDNIVVMRRNPKNKRERYRVKGIVQSATKFPARVTLLTKDGEKISVRLNDVAFLSPPEPGWLER